MSPLSSLWSNTIIGGAVGLLFGGFIGHVIDNWLEPRDGSSQWRLKLQLLWENWVTNEWEKLTPLLGEANNETEAPPASDTPTNECQVCHGLVYDTPHREQTPGDWKMRVGVGFDILIEDLSCP